MSGISARAGGRTQSTREELDDRLIEAVLGGKSSGVPSSGSTTPSLPSGGGVGVAGSQDGGVRQAHHQRKVSLVGEDTPQFEEMDPSERYGRFNEELGRGACKVVYKAFDTQEGREVAWNKVDLGRGSGGLGDENVASEEQDRILAEIRVLKALKHKNIMSFYKWWYNEEKGQVNFISEMFASGTLRRYRKKHKHLGDDVLKQWGWQILSGLVYLHGHKPPIVHRDLKCDNIFINGADGVVKIGDLGLATMLHGRTAPQSVIGTPEFMAPELYDEYYDDRVDVYAFGMVMLELATMEYPYSECSNAAQIYRKVMLQVRPMGLQKVACKELADFINTCIAPLEQRPRSRQLLKHPYFASIRNSLHPSKSDLFLASAAAENGNGANGPRSSSAALGRAPLSGGSTQSGGMGAAAAAASQISRSMSASPAPTGMFQEAVQRDSSGVSNVGNLINGKMLSSELMRELVEKKVASGGVAHSSGVGSMTPTPSQRSARGGGLPSPPRERLPSPLGQGPLGGHRKNGGNGTAHNGPLPKDLLNGNENGAGAQTPATGQKRRKGICRCAATNRCFEFAGKYREDRGKRLLSLRLKIVEPDETSRTIEFEFDMTSDTATSVASEMVGILELSPEDAVAISEAMEAEISQLLSSLEVQASSELAQAVGEFQHELSSALQHASSCDAPGSGDTVSGGNSLEPPRPRVQPRSMSGLSRMESMASLQSMDSMRSHASRTSNHSDGNHSELSTPSRSANRSPLFGSTEDLQQGTSLIRQGSSELLSKLHSNVDKTVKSQTPPGGSSRSSFEMRLSPREGELSRESSSLENRSLKKLYESLQQVSEGHESPGATTKPPLPPSKPSLSGQTSLHSGNSGLSEVVMKDVVGTGTSSGPGSINSDKGEDDKMISKEDKLQQAMNALKVVESRSLELLGGGTSKKGVPMKEASKRSEEVSLDPFVPPGRSHPTLDLNGTGVQGTVAANSSHESIDILGANSTRTSADNDSMTNPPAP